MSSSFAELVDLNGGYVPKNNKLFTVKLFRGACGSKSQLLNIRLQTLKSSSFAELVDLNICFIYGLPISYSQALSRSLWI